MVYSGRRNNIVVLAKYLGLSVIKLSYMAILALHIGSSGAVEYVVPVVGSTFSSATTGYVSGVVYSVGDWLKEYPKTFDNEFNEAVCGIERDKLRRITENSLEEIKRHADSSIQTMGNDVNFDFKVNFFTELAQTALKHAQKYELAITTLDFIEQTKRILDDALFRLEGSLAHPHSARIYGETKAKQLDSFRQENVEKARNTVLTWKMNLLAALHQKYPYTCEGGIGDRWGRSFNRHKERGKYWGIRPDWWRGGAVDVPKIDLGIQNPFLEKDSSVEAKLVQPCHEAYKSTLEMILKPIEDQIGVIKLDYIVGLQEQFAKLFPDKTLTSIYLDKPALLLSYIHQLTEKTVDELPTESSHFQIELVNRP